MFRVHAFIPTHDAKEKIEQSEEVAAGINRTAKAILEHARSDAPKRTAHGYASKFRMVDATEIDGKMTAYVVNDDVAASIIEFGSVNNPPYRTLTRAAQSAGRFEDAGRQ